jgi:hypothetical protein
MPRNNAEMAQYGDDKGLWVEFFTEAVSQPFESEKAGRPIYKEEVFIHILTPGAKTDIKRRVRLTQEEASGAPTDPERFPRQWVAFQAKGEQISDGTPIEQWPPIGKAQALEFKAVKIHTVEQLAAIPDNALHNFGMNGRRLRDLAKAFIDKAGEGAALSSALATIETQRLDIEALKTQFAELAAASKKGK